MNRSEYMAIRPQFLSKYIPRYDAVKSNHEIQAGIVDRIIQSAQQDLDDQYSHVLRIDGDTAYITIAGPLSDDGPDWVDLYLGYNGTAYKNIIRAAEEALQNPQIKRIIVPANTPGGNVDGADAAYQALFALAQKKQCTVINRGMIASAGVWLSSACGKIIASTPSAMIGSIGVVIDTMDFTGYYDSMGIKEISITNTESPNKRPDINTPSGQQIYIKELDALYGVFVDRVTTGMPVTRSAIKALKGEMIIAADAVKIGLMSGIEGQTPASETKAGKSMNGEKAMDEETKKALDTMSTNISAVTETVGKLTASVEKIVAKPEAKEEQEEKLSKEDKTFCLNILSGTAYPKTVSSEAGKVLAGESGMGILKAMVAAVDAVNAKPEPDAENPGETVPVGSIPTNGPKSKANEGIIDSEESAKAEIQRVRGEA